MKRGDVCVVRMVPLKPLVLESFADYPPLGRICWYLNAPIRHLRAQRCGASSAHRFDSGCIVAVGVVKTTQQTKADLPQPPKLQAARDARAARAAAASAGRGL